MSFVFRVIAFVSVSLNVLIIVGASYVIFAFWDNLIAIKNAMLLCSMEEFDSVAAAAAVGRLDLVSLLLAFLGIIIAIIAFGGFWMFRREAIEVARQEAQSVAPSELTAYMNANGTALVQGCLDHGEFVASLQVQLDRFGIEDADGADSVDADPNWKENDD